MSVFAASDTVVEFELVYEQYDEYNIIQYRKLFMDVLEKSFGNYLKYRASGTFVVMAVETEEEADIRVSYSRDDLSMRIEGIGSSLTTEEESNVMDSIRDHITYPYFKRFLLVKAGGGEIRDYADEQWKNLEATREGTRIRVEGGIEPRKIYEVVIEPTFVSKSVKGILDEALANLGETTVRRLASHKYELLEGDIMDVHDAITATMKDNLKQDALQRYDMDGEEEVLESYISIEWDKVFYGAYRTLYNYGMALPYFLEIRYDAQFHDEDSVDVADDDGNIKLYVRRGEYGDLNVSWSWSRDANELLFRREGRDFLYSTYKYKMSSDEPINHTTFSEAIDMIMTEIVHNMDYNADALMDELGFVWDGDIKDALEIDYETEITNNRGAVTVTDELFKDMVEKPAVEYNSGREVEVGDIVRWEEEEYVVEYVSDATVDIRKLGSDDVKNVTPDELKFVIHERRYESNKAIREGDIVEYENTKFVVSETASGVTLSREDSRIINANPRNLTLLRRALRYGKYYDKQPVRLYDRVLYNGKIHKVRGMSINSILKKQIYITDVEEPVDVYHVFFTDRNFLEYPSGRKMNLGDCVILTVDIPYMKAEEDAFVEKTRPTRVTGHVMSGLDTEPRLLLGLDSWKVENDIVPITVSYWDPIMPYDKAREVQVDAEALRFKRKGLLDVNGALLSVGDLFVDPSLPGSITYTVKKIGESTIVSTDDTEHNLLYIKRVGRAGIRAVPGILYNVDQFTSNMLLLPEKRVVFLDPSDVPPEPDLSTTSFDSVEARNAYVKKYKEEYGCDSFNNSGNRVYPVKLITLKEGRKVPDLQSKEGLLFVFCAESLKMQWQANRNRASYGINPINRRRVEYVVYMTQAEVEAQRVILQPKVSMKAEAKAAISFKDGITQMRIRAVKASIETIEKKLSGDAPLGKDDDRESLEADLKLFRGKLQGYQKALENPRLRLETYRAQLEELRAEKARVDSLVERYRRREIQLTEEQEYFLSGQYNSFRSPNRSLNPILQLEDLIKQEERAIEEQERQKKKRSSDGSGGGGRKKSSYSLKF